MRKSKCLLIVLAKLLYLDRVGRADSSSCHLEEIWLFVTVLSHPNGNVGESTPSGNSWHNEGELVMSWGKGFGNLFSEKSLHLPRNNLIQPLWSINHFWFAFFDATSLNPATLTSRKISRAGHLRYFFIFSIIKCFLHFLY